MCGAAVSLSVPAKTFNQLAMDITNTSGIDITIDRVYTIWVESSPNQKLDQLSLDGNPPIWNTSDPDSPSDLPSEGGGSWPGAGSTRTIANATSRNLVILFQELVGAGTYEVHIVFNAIPCQVTRSVNLP